MNWLDITLLVVLGLGAILGARTGLIWQVARILSFVAAVYGCIYYHGHAASLLTDHLTGTSPLMINILAYVVIFLAVYLVLFGVAYILENGLKIARLKPLDRFLGAGLGFAKAGLLAGIALTVVAVLSGPGQSPQVITESTIAPALLETMKVVIVAVPADVKDKVTTALDGARKKVEETVEEEGFEAAQRAFEKFKANAERETDRDR